MAHDAGVDGEAETKALRRGITMPLRALPEDESGRAIPIHEWAVINMSSGGARVRRTSTTSYPVTVGEIVGIRGPGKLRDAHPRPLRRPAHPAAPRRRPVRQD